MLDGRGATTFHTHSGSGTGRKRTPSVSTSASLLHISGRSAAHSRADSECVLRSPGAVDTERFSSRPAFQRVTVDGIEARPSAVLSSLVPEAGTTPRPASDIPILPIAFGNPSWSRAGQTDSHGRPGHPPRVERGVTTPRRCCGLTRVRLAVPNKSLLRGSGGDGARSVPDGCGVPGVRDR